ncbi:MAG: AAA family ATPase, partial [Thermoplasmata archaeon]
MARLVVSQNERLMLHLLELDKYRDDAEVPMGVSQEGIAQKLQVQVHSASRALASLQVDGLVSDRLAHVRGAPKRRRAYFLTDKGRRAAQALKSDLSRRMVVVEHAGRTQELPLEDALRKIASLTGTSPSFTEIVDMARAQDAIRSEDLAGAASGRIASPEFVERSHGRPRVGLFFGRETERRAFIEALSGPEVSAILLLGMPGIGKSTLASKLFDELAGKWSMFWYSFREWDTEGSFLNALAEFFSACGRHNLASALRRGAGHSELFAPIVNDLQGLGALLFLDDVQKPARELAPLPMLTEESRASRSAKFVLISRSVPTFFSRT